MATNSSARRDVAFNSSGDECRAWLFLPDAERTPLVILGHGLGATREYGLEPYARRFADAGIAALVFTYRHFGDSGGEPRQLLDIERQLDDWAAALAYARNLDGIDTARIALWGTSFGGGHVLVAAARFLLHVGLHRPGRSARKVSAPILFCICDTDAVAPPETALRYAATAPRGEVKRYPVGHFDIYLGEPFEHAVADQTEFLVRHLEVA